MTKAKQNEIAVGLSEHSRTGGDCYGCPYRNEPFCHHKLCEDALELLKAREPKVIRNSAGNGICPGCGRIIPAWSSPNHCGYCGQAVKWE